MRKNELSHHISTCLDQCTVNKTYGNVSLHHFTIALVLDNLNTQYFQNVWLLQTCFISKEKSYTVNNEPNSQWYTKLILVSFKLFKVENEKIDSKFQIPVSTWTAPACDEDWDEGKCCLWWSFLKIAAKQFAPPQICANGVCQCWDGQTGMCSVIWLFDYYYSIKIITQIDWFYNVKQAINIQSCLHVTEMDKNATIASSFVWGMSMSQQPQDRSVLLKLYNSINPLTITLCECQFFYSW